MIKLRRPKVTCLILNMKRRFLFNWCEGAIFIIGFEKGLTEWRPLLSNKGCLGVSELSWLREEDEPEEIRSYIKGSY